MFRWALVKDLHTEGSSCSQDYSGSKLWDGFLFGFPFVSEKATDSMLYGFPFVVEQATNCISQAIYSYILIGKRQQPFVLRHYYLTSTQYYTNHQCYRSVHPWIMRLKPILGYETLSWFQRCTKFWSLLYDTTIWEADFFDTYLSVLDWVN